MDDLLFWFFIATLLFVVAARRRRRAAPEENPVLGYRKIDGEQLILNPLLAALGSGPWAFIALEDMPFAKRRRVVLSLAATPDALPDEGLEALLWRIATYLQQRAAAHVVVIEAFENPDHPRTGTGRMRLLYAPDGLGWSGKERILAALDGSAQPLRTFDLATVHRTLLGLETA